MPEYQPSRQATGNEKEHTPIKVSPPQVFAKIDPSNSLDEEGRVLGLKRELCGWDVYNNEAKKVDTELVKDWTASLNFLLLFAAIFAAVLTAFIIESKNLLEQDPSTVMMNAMIFYINNVANGTHTSYTPAAFEPSSTDITVNCLFFASLSASLVAALASVVALQWVADYDSAITRGGSSPEDRAKRRQFRHAGMLKWKMAEIIAALPLLLYFSVMLFFGGLLLWMWVINEIVGAVVAGGALVAVLFYAISTFIAVAFVSSPFRTPLSRWIYSLCQIPFPILHWFASLVRVSVDPSWLRRQYLSQRVAHKREERAVDDRSELGKDALVWLANQLSISEESYTRLLLLVGELASLSPAYMPSFDSREALWFSIFDLLGWKLLTDVNVENPSDESKRGMAVLQKCYAIPAVQKLVFPSVRHNYINDSNRRDYWRQHCGTVGTRTWDTHYDGPNRLFLLLRDNPLPSEFSSQEMEVCIRLSRWRNAARKKPHVWDEVFNLSRTLSPEFFNSCVSIFGSFTRTHNTYRRRDDVETQTYIAMTSTVFQIATTRGDLSRRAMTSLIQTYESLLIGEQNTGDRNSIGITAPLIYGKILQLRSNNECRAHGFIPVLLSRQIGSYTGARRAALVREVILMLWLRPSYPGARNWDRLIEQFGARSSKLDAAMKMDWIRQVDSFPYMEEVLRNLAAAQAEDPTVGPLWRSTTPGRANDPHFVEALQVFDSLMGPWCTPEDHCTMIQLVCQELEQNDPPCFDDYFTPALLARLARLRDPCLQTLAKCAQGAGFTIPNITSTEFDERKASWERIQQHLWSKYPVTYSPRILELQASLWSASLKREGVYSRALTEPDIYCWLQRVFRYPVVCPGCVDGPGHLLFHILEGHNRKFTSDLTLLSEIPLNDRDMSLSLFLLCLWYRQEPVSLRSLVHHAPENTSLLEESFHTVTLSQFHLLSFILNVSRTLESGEVYPEDLGTLLVCTRRALLTMRPEPESTSILASLSSSLLRVREATLAYGARSFAEREAAAREAVRTSQLLLSTLAQRSVFGLHNNRKICCARARGWVNAAVGWLPPFDG